MPIHKWTRIKYARTVIPRISCIWDSFLVTGLPLRHVTVMAVGQALFNVVLLFL